MGPQLVLFAVFFSGLCASAFGKAALETGPCLTSRENCTLAVSSVSILNNNYFCCKIGYSMSMTNNHCTCTKISEVIDCPLDPRACLGANSFSSDGNGHTHCCPPGFSMSSFSTFVNGLSQTVCKCTRPLPGAWNAGSSIIVNGNGGIFVGGNPGNFNSTEFAQRMHGWAHRFRNSMAAMSSNLQRNLSRMFRSLGMLG